MTQRSQFLECVIIFMNIEQLVADKKVSTSQHLHAHPERIMQRNNEIHNEKY